MLNDLDHIFRQDYSLSKLSESSVDINPFNQFKFCFDNIIKTKIKQPNSMILSTVDATGVPSTRVVLLKQFDENGFVFFTNYKSTKGSNIDKNDQVSLLFFSIELELQIHIHGKAYKIPYDESNKYFKSRPFGSQIAAMASKQSTVVESRVQLEKEFKVLYSKYENSPPECPNYWGGINVVPYYFEF